MNYGEKIARLRKKNRMTQAELGDELNVTYQAVSKWERGESLPDFETISKMAKIFQVPISYFEDGVEEASSDLSSGVTLGAQAVQADIIGMCVQCGKVVREGEEAITNPKLICKACVELERQAEEDRINAEQREREAEVQRRKNRVQDKKGKWKKVRNIALLVALIPAVIVFVTFLVMGLQAENKGDFISYFAPGCILAVFAYTFTSQMIWGKRVEGIVYSICTGGGHIMNLPGVIFSFSPDGLIFLLIAKVVLFFIAIVV
ncbi:MAG: helix-turn-helix domain-containing protein, partial [Clostridia bacterium]|nr:helix-turn-helix domain-containing protein [Clostridia bacterium]